MTAGSTRYRKQKSQVFLSIAPIAFYVLQNVKSHLSDVNLFPNFFKNFFKKFQWEFHYRFSACKDSGGKSEWKRRRCLRQRGAVKLAL